MSLVLAFFTFGPISAVELFVVLMAALMIFGGRLPEVALRAVAHVMRARRALSRMWRDTGLEDELRRVRRDIEMAVPRDADFDVPAPKAVGQDPARLAAERAREGKGGGAALGAPEGAEGDDEFSMDPDADRREEYSFEPVDDAVAHGDIEPADGGGAGASEPAAAESDAGPGPDTADTAGGDGDGGDGVRAPSEP